MELKAKLISNLANYRLAICIANGDSTELKSWIKSWIKVSEI